MTIGVDIRMLGTGPRGGVQEYTENLLEHLTGLERGIRYKLFYSSSRTPLPDYDFLHRDNVRLYAFKAPNKLLFYGARLAGIPRIDKILGGVDVFFSPHFFLAPLTAGTKRVTTYHDLSYERFPEFFSWRQRFWHHIEMRPAWQAKFSDAVIAVSESTKRDLVERYDIDPAKIFVVYSGADVSLRRPDNEALERFRDEKRLPEHFILYLGTLEPRKNIVGIIKAFDRLKELPAFSHTHLVLAGAPGWLYRDIYAQAESSPNARSIHCTGPIGRTERPFYLSLASVLVYPSFFEGFGLPPLEAMICGTPVVASNNSSLPEVVADAGILVNPYDTFAIANALASILKDEKLRNDMIAKGFARAARFSWRRCAEETLSVLTGV